MPFPLIAAAALGLNLFGSFAQGAAAKKQGRRAQAIANFNARMLEGDAVRTRIAGFEVENDHRRATAELMSRQRTGFAASGVIVDSGSAAQIQSDTVTLGEIDAMRIRRSYRDKAKSLDDQATLVRMGGEARAKAGDDAFLGSILSGGAKFASGIYSLRGSSGSSGLTGSAASAPDSFKRAGLL